MHRKKTTCPNGECGQPIELEVTNQGGSSKGDIPQHDRSNGQPCVLNGVDYFELRQMDENR